MTCDFCTIARDATRLDLAADTGRLVVFADHRPVRPGHVQIVPKVHVEVFDELPEDLAAEIVILGQRIARAQKCLYGVRRVGFVFTGNEVPHVHAHVIPLHAPDDVTSARYRDPGVPRISRTEQDRTAAALRAALQSIGSTGR